MAMGRDDSFVIKGLGVPRCCGRVRSAARKGSGVGASTPVFPRISPSFAPTPNPFKFQPRSVETKTAVGPGPKEPKRRLILFGEAPVGVEPTMADLQCKG